MHFTSHIPFLFFAVSLPYMMSKIISIRKLCYFLWTSFGLHITRRNRLIIATQYDRLPNRGWHMKILDIFFMMLIRAFFKRNRLSSLAIVKNSRI